MNLKYVVSIRKKIGQVLNSTLNDFTATNGFLYILKKML